MRRILGVSLCISLAPILSGQIQPGLTIKAIATGNDSSLALASDGTVWAWGDNSHRQLGDGTKRNRSTPVRVRGLTNVVGIAAGGSHGLALNGDGTVWAWGNGVQGQLGEDMSSGGWIPVQVSGLAGVVAIAAGGVHSLALKADGTVWAWGGNGSGQLGDGTTIWGRAAPVRVSGLTGIAAIAAGVAHNLALASNGTLWAWGHNYFGQLGDGTTVDQLTPVQVSGVDGVVAIAAGGLHSLALTRDGSVWAWGSEGSGGNHYGPKPVQVSGISRVATIAAGFGNGDKSLAVREDGTVWAWGGNTRGELGDGTTTDRTTPVQVVGLAGAVAVAAGSQHSLALKGDGTIWAWGRNSLGQLGDGAVLMRSAPRKVSGLEGVVAVAGRPRWALKDDGTVWEWGGQAPAPVPRLIGITAIAGGDANLALTSDRYVRQWEPTTQTLTWVSGLSGVVAISAGVGDWSPGPNLAVKDDGTVWEWEWFGGQQPPLSQVGGLDEVVGVAAGFWDAVSLAVKRDGTVWQWSPAWGGAKSAPVQVTGLSGVKAIASAFEQNVALNGDGSVWEWATPGSTPIQVKGLTGPVALAPGDNVGWQYGGDRRASTLALKADGTVWAWGNNWFGQLGDGTGIDRPTPVQVAGLSGVVAIGAGSLYSVAVKSDGTVWEWGEGSEEQNPVRTKPVQVVPPGAPDLAIEMSPYGDFTVGTQGVYALTITNIGFTATAGEVTVTATLPAGLTYVSATGVSGGSDWTCSAAEETATCMNPGAVEPGASSVIALVVDVAAAAYPGVTNLATLTNASDRNPSNNTIGSPTLVRY